jgi:hypothetical protein
MKSGRFFPYVARLLPECADPETVPATDWPFAEPDVRDTIEAHFQREASGAYRAEFMLDLLAGSGSYRQRFPSGLVPRIEAYAAGFLRRFEDELARLEDHIQPNPEIAIGERLDHVRAAGLAEFVWWHPSLTHDQCEARHAYLTARIADGAAWRAGLLLPYLTVRAELAERLTNHEERRDGPGLWTFWRQPAKLALRRYRPRPEADDDDDE